MKKEVRLWAHLFLFIGLEIWELPELPVQLP
jgi:hypothetical protein